MIWARATDLTAASDQVVYQDVNQIATEASDESKQPQNHQLSLILSTALLHTPFATFASFLSGRNEIARSSILLAFSGSLLARTNGTRKRSLAWSRVSKVVCLRTTAPTVQLTKLAVCAPAHRGQSVQITTHSDLANGRCPVKDQQLCCSYVC